MPKPQLKRAEDLPLVSASEDYAPKQYSAREHAAMGVKMLLLGCGLFGLLWLLNAIAVK